MTREYQFAVDNSQERLDKLVSAQLPDITRSAIQLLFQKGLIRAGEQVLTKNAKLHVGTLVTVFFPEPAQTDVLPQAIALEIVYEDEDLLVVNKPKGMVVHPAPGNPDGTLVNALLAHCGDSLSGINGVVRPGIVHRIDKDTSGLLIVAKNDFTHVRLAEQIKEHSFTREYSAVVYGRIKEEKGTVDAPIGRHPVERKKMAILSNGKTARRAVTHYEVVKWYRDFTRLRLRLETGRTHQIRVHMASLGHPVAGDPIYGPKKVILSLQGQCLHAGRIGFRHPRTGMYLELEAPLPEYFTAFLAGLKDEL